MARVRRGVLLGNLEPVVRLGMIRVLEDGGLEVVGSDDRPDALVEQARRLQPDAIVLGLDARRLERSRRRAYAPRPRRRR